MGADVLDVERAADHGFQRVIGGVALRDVELGVAQVADARGEAEAQEVHRGEDVIGEPRRVECNAPRSASRTRGTASRRARRSNAHADVHDLGVNCAYWSKCGCRTSALGCSRISGLCGRCSRRLLPVRKFWPSDDEWCRRPIARRRDGGTVR